MILRPARPADIAAIDTLLARSYPRLLRADYPASVLVTALPRIVRAQPALIASGTYFVIEEDGAIRAAGGWTRAAPGRGRSAAGTGNIRHVATDPDQLRRGLASRLMDHVVATARAAGMARLDCLSTRTARPFYAARGFREIGPTEVSLGPGIVFPAIRMVREPI